MAIKTIKLVLIFCFFSILGTFSRKGTNLLSVYPGTYLSGIVWCNFAACLAMGIVSTSSIFWKYIMDPSEKSEISNKKQILLFIGLSTGFCGTYSSFATFILELFLDTSNINVNGYYPFANPAYGILQFISIFITELSMSCAAFAFGANIARYVEDHYMSNISYNTQWIRRHYLIETALEILGVAFVILFVVLSIVKKSWRQWTLSALFSPPACYLRYYLAQKFNKPRKSKFHINFYGTFFANVLACLILAIVTLLNRGKRPNGRIVTEVLDCQVLNAMADGFCGTLSTVSTFVAELYAGDIISSGYYCLVSIITCFILNLLIIGSYNWTIGLAQTGVC